MKERAMAHDNTELFDACEDADLVVGKWDGGKLILKRANDGLDHRLEDFVDLGDGDEYRHVVRDVTTRQKLTLIEFECESEADAFKMKRLVEKKEQEDILEWIKSINACVQQGKSRQEIIDGMSSADEDTVYLIDCALESIAIAKSANTPEEEDRLVAEVLAKRKRRCH
jgi:hypothetical protein